MTSFSHRLILFSKHLTTPGMALMKRLSAIQQAIIVGFTVGGFFLMATFASGQGYGFVISAYALVCAYLIFSMQALSMRMRETSQRAFARAAKGAIFEENSAANRQPILGKLIKLHQQLTLMAGSTRHGANEVSGACRQLDENTAALSLRAEEIAAMLEETASAMEEFSATIERNTANTKEATERANKSASLVLSAQGAMDKLLAALSQTRQESENILEAIELIEQIAFQTNLLALNAAIEAARAGEQGRGFAVVAQEVRKLSQRASQSAAQLKQIVSEGITEIGDSLALTKNASLKIGGISFVVEKTHRLIEEISRVSTEQTEGVEQIKTAIEQMASITQQNAAAADAMVKVSAQTTKDASSLLTTLAEFSQDRFSHSDIAVSMVKYALQEIESKGLEEACMEINQQNKSPTEHQLEHSLSVWDRSGKCLACNSDSRVVGRVYARKSTPDIPTNPASKALETFLEQLKTKSSAWGIFEARHPISHTKTAQLVYAENSMASEVYVTSGVYEQEKTHA